MDTLGDLTLNPVALITGAASGIGAACARQLAAKAKGGLILVDLEDDALSATADALADAPERVSTLAFDVADAQRWAQAAEFITAQYGRLDYAVVNAGIPPGNNVADTTLEDWRRVMSVNLDGALLSLRAVMPIMRLNSSGGAIVVTGSASGINAAPGAGAYAASKSGVMQLMRVAAKEGAGDRIRVNAVSPGGIEPTMWNNVPLFQDLVRETGSEHAAFDRIAQMQTPLARYAAEDDVAKLILMLLMDSSPISGATLVVDGGYTL